MGVYKLQNNPQTGKLETIKRLSDGAFIPFDEANRDYRDYLAWVAEGNTPDPAEES